MKIRYDLLLAVLTGEELASEQEPENEVPTEDGTIVVRAAAFDAYRVRLGAMLGTEPLSDFQYSYSMTSL